jgi:hypothetical protein
MLHGESLVSAKERMRTGDKEDADEGGKGGESLAAFEGFSKEDMT